MNDFTGKVAVITGAASGIGRAIAERCASEKMRLVLADIEEPTLAQTVAELESRGATVMGIPTDVSHYEAVEALANVAFATYGAVDLLVNNAGVAAGSTVHESAIHDWQWVLGVNLFGVIHGVKAFVPRMLSQNTECHVVNTASVAGLVAGPGMGIYNVSKHGVVVLSETLHHELTALQAQVKVSVLCPGYVRTRILESERNRPAHLPTDGLPESDDQTHRDTRREAIETGMEPAQVATALFEALQENRFYVITHPDYIPLVGLRMTDILQGRNPTNPLEAALKLMKNTTKDTN